MAHPSFFVSAWVASGFEVTHSSSINQAGRILIGGREGTNHFEVIPFLKADQNPMPFNGQLCKTILELTSMNLTVSKITPP
jgi:hypothetical protein